MTIRSHISSPSSLLTRSLVTTFALLAFALSSASRVSAQEGLPVPLFDVPLFDAPALPSTPAKPLSPFGDDMPTEPSGQRTPSNDMEMKNSGALNNLFSHQWVHRNADGGIQGTVVTLVGEDTLSVSGIRVVLAQKGRIIANVESNTDGAFAFDDVAPGYYSIIAEADNSFATFGLAVMDSGSGSHLPSNIEVRVIRPKGDSIRRILDVDSVPSRVSDTYERLVRDPNAAKRIFSKSHRVLSTREGKVVGRLSKLGVAPDSVDMSQMKAMLLKDGVEIGRSNVTRDGAFEFDRVEPGCYGFAAAGNRGIAAVAFCVVKPDSMTQLKSSDGNYFVSAVQDTASPQLNVEVADNADVMSTRETNSEGEEIVAVEEPLPIQPMPIGGSNMFGAGQVIPGGSGGAQIGGLVKDLAGLAALGAIAYVVAKEFDDNDDVVSPIVRR